MSALKFCNGCGEYCENSKFKTTQTIMGPRRSHRCNECVRRLMNAVNPKKAMHTCPIRQRELELIPDPFAKKHLVTIEQHPFLWAGSF